MNEQIPPLDDDEFVQAVEDFARWLVDAGKLYCRIVPMTNSVAVIAAQWFIDSMLFDSTDAPAETQLQLADTFHRQWRELIEKRTQFDNADMV